MSTKQGRIQRASIRDVARLANVSCSTASCAISGGVRNVSEELRERVLLAAAELGYSTNSVARSLSTGRTHTIGVMVHRLGSVVSARQLDSIASILEQRHYKMLISVHRDDERTAISHIEDMWSRQLDGIISVGRVANISPFLYEQLLKFKIPFVFSYQEPNDLPGVDAIVVDQVQGGLIATEHLLEIGRRSIAFVGGPMHRLVTEHRLEGFRVAHEAFGVSVREDQILLQDEFFINNGIFAAETLLQKPALPDAVFAISDGLAIGVMRRLTQAGVRVPEDVAIVGFDDSVMARAVHPTLTSVEMPLVEIGKLAATRLVDRIENSSEWIPQVVKVPCNLVVRDSTVPGVWNGLTDIA